MAVGESSDSPNCVYFCSTLWKLQLSGAWVSQRDSLASAQPDLLYLVPVPSCVSLHHPPPIHPVVVSDSLDTSTVGAILCCRVPWAESVCADRTPAPVATSTIAPDVII